MDTIAMSPSVIAAIFLAYGMVIGPGEKQSNRWSLSMHSVDVITQRHVANVLDKHHLPFFYSRSYAVTFVGADKTPAEVIRKLLEEQAPPSQYSLWLSSSGLDGQLLREHSKNSTLPRIKLTDQELSGTSSAPWDVEPVLKAIKARFAKDSESDSIGEPSSVSFIPRMYLGSDYKYHVAFEVYVSFQDIAYKAQIIESKVLGIIRDFPPGDYGLGPPPALRPSMPASSPSWADGAAATRRLPGDSEADDAPATQVQRRTRNRPALG